MHNDLFYWVERLGYAAAFSGIFLESIGIPFPGETLLLASAAYAGAGHLAIAWVVVAAALGSVCGGNVGYAVGRLGGRALVQRYGGWLHVGQERFSKAEHFYLKYGGPTVFFGRFVTVLRAYGALIAGAAVMPYPVYLAYTVLGSCVWAVTYGLIGFYLGQQLPAVIQLVSRVGWAALLVVLLGAVVLVLRRRFGQRR